MSRVSRVSSRPVPHEAIGLQSRQSFRAARSGNAAARVHPARERTLLAIALCLLAQGCERNPQIPELVAYVSVDQPFAERILADFTKSTGIRVRAAYDSEAGKTTGLVRKLMRESSAPLCDVFWSSEVFGTIELARAGVLEPCDSPGAADIPMGWRDAAHRWTGCAARARVIAFPADRPVPDERSRSWESLAEGSHPGTLAIANPLFGTTRGHFAALLSTWGRDRTIAYARQLRDSKALLADGNSHAVRLVAAGQADWCWTDTDDVWAAQRNGARLGMAYPKLSEGGPIWIPCSVSLIRGAPHKTEARRLVDYLVSAAVEEALARSDSHNVPVRTALRERLASEASLHPYFEGIVPSPMEYERIADAMSESSELVREAILR